MRATVYRKEHFNAAHRLHNPNWSEEKNQTVFGKCNNSNYHGHNYELVVSVTGEIDPETGYVIDMKELGDLIRQYVVEKLDHKNLNLDVPEFQQLNPSAEYIAYTIWQILREKIHTRFDLRVRLYETERNFTDFPAIS
jgi:6-pyruvoyltetrahydropterin/6-carboxytetrahydropterin synthase